MVYQKDKVTIIFFLFLENAPNQKSLYIKSDMSIKNVEENETSTMFSLYW